MTAAMFGHEAAHRLLFPNRTVNDFVGRCLVGYPTFQPMLLYRRAHFAHHKDEMGRGEPDASLYAGYGDHSFVMAAKAVPRSAGQHRQEGPDHSGDGCSWRVRRAAAGPDRPGGDGVGGGSGRTARHLTRSNHLNRGIS